MYLKMSEVHNPERWPVEGIEQLSASQAAALLNALFGLYRAVVLDKFPGFTALQCRNVEHVCKAIRDSSLLGSMK